jgi:hypothetical protein
MSYPVIIMLNRAYGTVWLEGYEYAGAAAAGIRTFSELLTVSVIVHPNASEIRSRPNTIGAPAWNQFPPLKEKRIRIIVIEIAAETPIVVQPISACLS